MCGVRSFVDACSTKPRRYSKPFEEYRQRAGALANKLEAEIETRGRITWERIMQAADRDEVVYKLALKYLRQDGYDIGNYKQPFVTKK
ncbi:MAG: hypothetical protein ACE5J2_05300 [Nitrososphaerales archaeon]